MYTYEACKKVANNIVDIPNTYGKLYEDFIVSNASSIGSIESGLRSLTYIIPGRFRDAEIASESLHCFVQLISLYHDSLLGRAVERLPKPQRPKLSLHNRYTQYWTSKSSRYHKIATTLRVIQYTELLCEMTAKTKGDRTRWKVVTLIECLKAICRLLLLRITGSRSVLSPPLPEREIDPSTLETSSSSSLSSTKTDLSAEDDSEYNLMSRTRLPPPILPPPGSALPYLVNKVTTAEDIKAPKQLVPQLTFPSQFAEILYILRPVIYASLMAYYALRTPTISGSSRNIKIVKSNTIWTPWIIGFVLEYTARQLQKRDIETNRPGGIRNLGTLEKEEWKKRGWQLMWWSMRGAFYQNITRSWVKGVVNKLKGKPGLDMIGGILDDYDYLWRSWYFATSTI